MWEKEERHEKYPLLLKSKLFLLYPSKHVIYSIFMLVMTGK